MKATNRLSHSPLCSSLGRPALRAFLRKRRSVLAAAYLGGYVQI
jgi:hypothetical protein